MVKLIQYIPSGARRRLADLLAGALYNLSFKHRLIAMHNLMRSFPEKSLPEIKNILRKSYSSFAVVVSDFFDIPSLKKEKLHHVIRVEGLENYREALKEAKGVLLFGAHFGNWEIGNAALALLTRPFVFLYRVFDSPFLEKNITGVRASYGNTSLSKDKAMRPILRLLKNGSTINMLIDQNVAWYDGVFVDFFGRQACTTTGLALLALHTKAPVLPAFTRRLPDGGYLLEIGKKVDIVDSGNRVQDVLTNTQIFTKMIEEQIRKYPEQWLWLHQRWKTRPCQIQQRGK
jgi:KDO2-lipid IV(A) lauroyltransferase